MSSLVKAELLATCNSLGCYDGDTYYKEDDCLDSIKDLLLFLKRDDNSCEIRRQLGETKVLQTDLVHILKAYKDDKELLNISLRLLVNLTTPALIVFEEKIPEEKVGRRYYLEIIGHLQEYKQAFCDDGLLQVLSDKLRDLLKLEWANRQEEDQQLVEWILILIRNVLHVPANPAAELRTDDDASIHDHVLWGLHKSGLEDLLLFIANSEDYHEYCLHALEIITLMLREQTPQQLAQAGVSRAQSEKQQDDEQLTNVRQQEALQQAAERKKHYSNRHSRFGGTYCVAGLKSISERELIVHRPIADASAVNFDRNKTARKKPKNLIAKETADVTRRSTLSIRMFLRDFCVEFLNSVYNSIMYIVKDQLARSRTQDHDETYYLWAIKFFMEFNRHYDFRVELVSETMSVSTLHYIQTQLDTYQEMMISDKKKIPLWSKRIHLGLKAYQELIMTLSAMDSSSDTKVRESSRVLKTNVFYMNEYRELPYLLLNGYSEAKMTKSYLKDLVEMNHVFLKMLEKHCTRHRHLVVEQKNRAKAAGKKTKAKKSTTKVTLSENQLEILWNEISLDASSAVQGNLDLPPTLSLFDATSEIPVDEQRVDAMRRLQGLIRSKQVPEAVSFFRAAREVWPQDNCFGASDILPEDELLALREICLTTLAGGPIFDSTPTTDDNPDEPAEDDDEEDEELAEANADIASRTEKEFEFKKFVARFATPKIIPAYASLLQQYEKNSDFTNHCVVKMFHRLAFDCGFTPILFQVSIFRSLQRLMDDPLSSTNSTLKEIVKFAKYLLRKFAELASKNKKLFIEILFWKSSKDCYDIEEGYGASRERSKRGMEKIWSEELENELKNLFEEHKDSSEEGKDAVDLILDHFSDATKTRRMIIMQLKRQNLVSGIRQFTAKKINKSTTANKIPKEFAEDEVAELQELYEKFKDADDILGRILDNLTVKRPKNRVVQKLLELGIVTSKADLRKKRTRKSGKSMSKSGDNQTSGSDDSSCDEEAGDSDTAAHTSLKKKATPRIAHSRKEIRRRRELQSDDTDSSSSEVDADSPQEFLNALKEAVSIPELNGPLSWVRDDLRDIAADRENDADLDAVPLVPILDENYAALDNPIFLRLLRSIGIEPPANEQESFWRYPARLTASKCNQRADLLTKGTDGTLDFSEIASSSVKPASSSKTFKRKPRMMTPRSVDLESSSDDDTPLSRSIITQPPSSSSQKQNQSDKIVVLLSQKRKVSSKRLVIASSSENDSELDSVPPSRMSENIPQGSDNTLELLEEVDVSTDIKKGGDKMTKRVLILSDTDSDADETQERTTLESVPNNKEDEEFFLSEDDDGSSKGEKRKFAGSDELENDSIVHIVKKSKRTFVIESDSD